MNAGTLENYTCVRCGLRMVTDGELELTPSGWTETEWAEAVGLAARNGGCPV